MPTIKVHLSIGYPTATHSDEIKINDNEWGKCKTDEERKNLLHEYASEWADNYIDYGYELVES